jgi:hypothetical protein
VRVLISWPHRTQLDDWMHEYRSLVTDPKVCHVFDRFRGINVGVDHAAQRRCVVLGGAAPALVSDHVA